MAIISVEKLTHNYGKVAALRQLSFTVPRGAIYALLGPNGSGKSTLLKTLAGIISATSGTANVLNTPTTMLTRAQRMTIGYAAEGIALPGHVKLREYLHFLRPLYNGWDGELEKRLLERFELDSDRRLGALSRGERMKAILLFALAPRPELLILDEPFAGLDIMVRDAITRGVLENAGPDGWTVVVASHDIDEIAPLADHVGILSEGQLVLSGSTDGIGERFRHVEVMVSDAAALARLQPPRSWHNPEWAGRVGRFILDNAGAGDVLAQVEGVVGTAEVTDRPASLREVFVAMARPEQRATISMWRMA